MKKLNLDEELEDYGYSIHQALMDMIEIEEEQAKELTADMDLGDYITLTQALDREDVDAVKDIVKKYTLKEPNLDKPEGVEESNFGHINKLDENRTTYGKDYLIREGYNYYAALPSDLCKDKFIDWLESGKYDFLVDENGIFHVNCPDRETAYKVGKCVNRLTRVFGPKGLVRDSDENEDDMFEGKNKRTKPENRPRNPVAPAAKQKKAGAMEEPYKKRKERQNDPMSRASKGHRGKLRAKDIDENASAGSENGDGEMSAVFKKGERVLFQEQRATVKYPKGPSGTIGIQLGENLRMVDPKDIRKLDEGVLGMTNVPGLKRMAQLAGIGGRINEDEYEDAVADELGLGGDAGMAGADMEPVGGYDSLDPGFDDFGGDMEADPYGDSEVAVASPEPVAEPEPEQGLGPDMMGDSGLNDDSSDAFRTITSNLDQIRQQMPDVRLDEYKVLLQRLEDLKDQLRSMGRDYLGERRKK